MRINIMLQTASTIALLALLALTAQAETTKYTINQLVADATLVASQGCVSAQIAIDGSAALTRSGRVKTPDFGGAIVISEFDSCLRQYQGGEGETDTISFSGDLESASLVGDIPVEDDLGNVRNIPVVLTWSGIGKVTTEKVEPGPGTSATGREMVWSRRATLTGTVDGLPVTATGLARLTRRSAVIDTQ